MQLHVLVGSIPHVKRTLKLLNRSLVIGPDGLIIKFYDKQIFLMFLLDNKEEYFESKNYDPGKTIPLLLRGNLGTTICYDLRFHYHIKTSKGG